MPVTVKVNGTVNSLVHKGSNGISMATIPDVCKTPSPGGPIPIPYPNISQSIALDKGTTTVKADGGMMIATKGSEFSLSNGDNAGVAGGVKSSTFMKESTWILYSFDVKMDGNSAARLTDKMLHNAENAANLGGVAQPPLIALLGGDQNLANKLCEAACKAMKKKKKADKKAKSKAKKGKKKQKPSTKKFQNEMRNELDPRQGGSRGKKNPGLLTEVGQADKDLIGKWGSEVANGRDFVKWDVVITKAGSTPTPKSLAVKDVKHFVEVKFPKDKLTDNQQNLLNSMSKSQKKNVVMMTVGTDPNATPPPNCLCT